MGKKTYEVQFLVVASETVAAENDIEAEKLAWASLRPLDRDRAVASCVLEDGHAGGALKGGTEGWAFAKQHFQTVDEEWLSNDS